LPQSSRGAAELLFDQLDGVQQTRGQAKKKLVKELRRHSVSKKLVTCPGMGDVRVARLMSVVVSPHRFRGRRQLWSYSGLGIVMRSSSDWDQAPDGNWQKVRRPLTRGLNKNCNRMLKKDQEPLYLEYLRQTKDGTKPTLAKVTLARKIAPISATMWKNQEVYDPGRRTNKTS